MTAAEISTAIAFVVLLTTGGGIIWRLAWKISGLESASEGHTISLAAVGLKNESLSRSLSEHEAFVARTYVSTEAIRDIKTDLVAAVNRLGDRLDSLFLQVAPHHKER